MGSSLRNSASNCRSGVEPGSSSGILEVGHWRKQLCILCNSVTVKDLHLPVMLSVT